MGVVEVLFISGVLLALWGAVALVWLLVWEIINNGF